MAELYIVQLTRSIVVQGVEHRLHVGSLLGVGGEMLNQLLAKGVWLDSTYNWMGLWINNSGNLVSYPTVNQWSYRQPHPHTAFPPTADWVLSTN